MGRNPSWGIWSQLPSFGAFIAGGIKPPLAPTGLSATQDGVDVDLAWTDNATNELGYRIYRSSNGSDYTLIDTIAAGLEAYTDTAPGLGPLWYKIAAYNNAGETESAAVEFHWIIYVDATGGNDANSGLATDAAWQTEAAINGNGDLASGDTILFKKGETWALSAALVPPTNGLSFGAYGTGDNPILDGQDTVNCITASGIDNLTFEDIECTQGLDSGFQFVNCDNVTVTNCDAHECGNDNLIFITGCNNCTVTGGSFYNGYQRTPTTQVTGIEIADDCTNITIDGAACYGQLTSSGHGISIHSHAATGMPTNITIKNCNLHDNAGYGLQVLKQDNTVDTGSVITVRDNTFQDNTLDGIRSHKSAGATAYPEGLTVYGNRSKGNTQYAYYFSCDNSTIRNNVWTGRGFLTACTGVNYWNNTEYFTTGLGLYPLYINNARTDNVSVRNRIIYASVAGGMMIGVDTAVTGTVTIDYSLYYLAAESVANTRWHWKGTAYNYANWLTNSGQDAHDQAIVDQDPLFTNIGADDFTLQAGSPAINVGVDVGLAYNGPAPDLGAYETS